jgi:hypothetical protein
MGMVSHPASRAEPKETLVRGPDEPFFSRVHVGKTSLVHRTLRDRVLVDQREARVSAEGVVASYVGISATDLHVRIGGSVGTPFPRHKDAMRVRDPICGRSFGRLASAPAESGTLSLTQGRPETRLP